MSDKPYPTRCPRVGETVYIPSMTSPYHVIGGLATVIHSDERVPQKFRQLAVEALPSTAFVWGDIKHLQPSLWHAFGLTQARLPTGEEIAALTAQREAARVLAEAKRAAAAQAETARWAPHRLQVMNGGLLEVPVWGDHYRCRNWGAIVALNPTLPGGLDRWWFNRGSGPVKLIVPNELDVHDPVEFGADYIRGSGYRDPERWYGVVLENEATHLLIEPCRDVLHALTLAAKRQES